MSETVIYDGVDLGASFIISAPSRPLPEFRVASTRIEGNDGESFDGLTYGPRECSFQLIAGDKSRIGIQRAARTLMEILSVRSPKPLQFSDEEDPYGNQLTRWAVPTGAFDAEEFKRAGRWTCRFVQPDPYLYGRDRALFLPRGETWRVPMGGNAPVYPYFTATPRGDYPLWSVGVFQPYKNSVGGYDWRGKVTFDSRYLDGSGQAFSGTNGLRCDMDAQTVSFDRMAYDSGKPVRGLLTDSRFFSLEGTERIQSMFTDSMMTWTERWL